MEKESTVVVVVVYPYQTMMLVIMVWKHEYDHINLWIAVISRTS